MSDTPNLKKLFVYNEETMMRLMDQYWDIFEDATLVPDKNDSYWVVTMKRPRRSPELVPVRTDTQIDLSPVFTKRQGEQKKG